MRDEPRVELPLPDDYNDLKALAAEHGIEHQGVKKTVLQAELCKIAERQAREARDGDEHEVEILEALPTAAAVDDDSDTDETVVHVAGDRVPITRVASNKAWTCPVCDHSNMDLIRACGGCGATRDGDEVVV